MERFFWASFSPKFKSDTHLIYLFSELILLPEVDTRAICGIISHAAGFAKEPLIRPKDHSVSPYTAH